MNFTTFYFNIYIYIFFLWLFISINMVWYGPILFSIICLYDTTIDFICKCLRYMDTRNMYI
jgi:hypothetical protein